MTKLRAAVVGAVEARAFMGADVNQAVPALLTLVDDGDVEVRRLVWRTLKLNALDPPHRDWPPLVAGLIRAAAADPDAGLASRQARSRLACRPELG